MKELTFEDCNELIEKLKSSSMSVKEEKYYQALVIARRTLQPDQQQYESQVIKNV